MTERKGKKKASASLDKLRSGIARETPATRVRGMGSGASEAEGTAATREGKNGTQTPAKRGRPPRPKTPERMVRVSVDVPRSRHKFLRDFAYDAEADGMSVMRALLIEMADDPRLQARVRDRLAGE